MLQGKQLIADAVLKAYPTRGSIKELLLKGITLAGMRLVCGPFLLEKGEGIVAFAILAESHTSLFLHHHPQGVVAHFDLFSCRPFEEERILKLLQELLQPLSLSYRTLVRP